MRRHLLLWLNLRTISSFPNYAQIIKNQASSRYFYVKKDSISHTSNTSSHPYNHGLKPKYNGKVKVMLPNK